MKVERNYEWVKVAAAVSAIPFGKNGLLALMVNERAICLVLFKGQVTAVSATCPHAGAKLCKGFVDAMGNVVCPMHHYRFSALSGRNISGEGYFLKTFPIEISPDGVFVSIEKNKAINFYK